jgi:hypothetical protein
MDTRGSVKIEVEGLNKLVNDLRRVASELTPTKRQRFLEFAAIPVRTQARANAPRSTKVHYVYKNVFRGVRRGKGKAKDDRVPVSPGNVAKSIAILKFKRDRSAVYVGPKYNPGSKQLNEVGRTIRTTDPFYAPMIYGSAEAFRQKVTLPAFYSKVGEVVRRLEKELNEYIRGIKRKTGL